MVYVAVARSRVKMPHLFADIFEFSHVLKAGIDTMNTHSSHRSHLFQSFRVIWKVTHKLTLRRLKLQHLRFNVAAKLILKLIFDLYDCPPFVHADFGESHLELGVSTIKLNVLINILIALNIDAFHL